MTLVRSGNAICNTGDSPDGDLPPGWCKQDPISGVSMYYDTIVFELRNSESAARIATVQRTFGNGQTDKFKFRVNDTTMGAPDGVYQVEWLAPQDTGSIQVVSVEDNTVEGGMDAYEQIHLFLDANPCPRIRNDSVHWVYVSLSIDFPDEGHTTFIRVIRSGSVWPIAQPWQKPSATFLAAESQRTNLYMPFP